MRASDCFTYALNEEAVVKVTVGGGHGVRSVLGGLGRTAGGRGEIGCGTNPSHLFDTDLSRPGHGLTARAAGAGMKKNPESQPLNPDEIQTSRSEPRRVTRLSGLMAPGLRR